MNRDDLLYDIKEFCRRHSRILMPVVLVVFALIVVFVAAHFHGRGNRSTDTLIQQEQKEETVPVTETQDEIPLEKNAYSDVNALFHTYYQATAEGNTDTIEQISTGLTAEEKIRIREIAKYIEYYPVVDVYTKKGPVEGSYVAYIYNELKFTGHDWKVPGLQTMYVCTREDGSLYINNEENQPAFVADYISLVSVEDDVVDLSNETTARYNSLVAGDSDLAMYLEELSTALDLSVGQELAKQSGKTQLTGSESDLWLVANDTVNVRKAPSQDAERIGEVTAGQRLALLESMDNGWSRVILNGQEAYVKTEYFHLEEPETPEESEETEAAEGE